MGGNADFGSRQPTLLLWGDRDEIAKPRCAEPLARCLKACFPQLDAYWIRGGGHNIQLDSAITVANLMESWLDRGSCDPQKGHIGLAEVLLLATQAGVEKMELIGEGE